MIKNSTQSITKKVPEQADRIQNRTRGYSLDDRQELAGLARNLRRAKRQMFLKEVEAPHTSVESFRDLVTRSVMSDLNGSQSSFFSTSTDLTEEKLAESRPSTSLNHAFKHVVEGPRAA